MACFEVLCPFASHRSGNPAKIKGAVRRHVGNPSWTQLNM